MTNVVVASAARTAVGLFNGSLANTPAHGLGAAKKGGNCKLTVMDEKIVTKNGVTTIGYTDFPSRMGALASTFYSTNIRQVMADLTPEKDGLINHDMEDDVIGGARVAFDGEISFRPPPPKVVAIAVRPKETVSVPKLR